MITVSLFLFTVQDKSKPQNLWAYNKNSAYKEMKNQSYPAVSVVYGRYRSQYLENGWLFQLLNKSATALTLCFRLSRMLYVECYTCYKRWTTPERCPTTNVTVQKGNYSPGKTTMVAISNNVLFPGHNHLLTCQWYWWSNTLIIAWAPASEGSSEPMVSRWLWPGNRTFLEVVSMVVT